MRYVCLIVAFSILCASSVTATPASGTNVPVVLSEKLERAAFKYTLWEAEAKDVYANHNKTFNEKEWNELAGYLMYINTKGASAGVAIALCQNLSQGSYCDEAAADLLVIEEQFKKLEKYSERLKSVRNSTKGTN